VYYYVSAARDRYSYIAFRTYESATLITGRPFVIIRTVYYEIGFGVTYRPAITYAYGESDSGRRTNAIRRRRRVPRRYDDDYRNRRPINKRG